MRDGSDESEEQHMKPDTRDEGMTDEASSEDEDQGMTPRLA